LRFEARAPPARAKAGKNFHFVPTGTAPELGCRHHRAQMDANRRTSMNKLVAIVAAFATTASLYATRAEAGCGRGYGFYRSSYRSVSRESKPRIAHKQSSTLAAPVAEPEAVTKTVAEAQIETKTDTALAVNTAPVTENSSITTPAAKSADAKPAETETTEKVATAAKDCKQFFPSVGIKLSVRCE